ncbi:helix-turn-helix domain-containing protein [Halobacterium zhouii]|uniref:helix-turn-helix domain-containing protein n=1 Tax=Halobacterium zhouii TaxID=2902624 RepID=UPI001E41254D|nr:helix-turn-helix domain-containing protein [Halobacterium zhouii]
MKRATLTASYPPDLTHPVHREVVERDAVSRADVLTWGPVGSATTLTWFDADRETVGALLDAVPPVTGATLVAGDDGTYAFTRQSEYGFAAELLELVASADVAFLPPLTFRGNRTARFEAVGPSAALGAFYDDLSARLDVTVASVRDVRRDGTPAALTDRQRAALDAAVDLGYYEVPRAASVEDVAEALGCASSTAGELLRRAEAAVIGDVAGSDTDRDAGAE